mgnify:CR=1 FL=1
MQNLKVHFTDIMDEQDAQSYAEKRLTPLEKFIKKDQESIKWNLRLSRNEHGTTAHSFTAEASLHSSKKNFGATAEAESLYAAIDELKDELQKKMSRFKGKRIALLKKGGRKVKALLRQEE